VIFVARVFAICTQRTGERAISRADLEDRGGSKARSFIVVVREAIRCLSVRSIDRRSASAANGRFSLKEERNGNEETRGASRAYQRFRCFARCGGPMKLIITKRERERKIVQPPGEMHEICTCVSSARLPFDATHPAPRTRRFIRHAKKLYPPSEGDESFVPAARAVLLPARPQGISASLKSQVPKRRDEEGETKDEEEEEEER